MRERTKPVAIIGGIVALIVLILAVALQFPPGGNTPDAGGGPAGQFGNRPSDGDTPSRGANQPGTSQPAAAEDQPRPGANDAPPGLPPDHPPLSPADEPIQFSLQYWGQSCFLITTGGGDDAVVVVTDPYDHRFTGYEPLDLRAHFVTISHEHRDHNRRAAIHPFRGQRLTVLDAGSSPVRRGNVSIRSVSVYHDPKQGGLRGRNAAFVMEIGGTRVVHLGDLGHILSPDQLAAIGPVDVLLAPVGGTFTIGPDEARQVVEQLKPKLVFPMHYRTRDTATTLADSLRPVESFTVRFPDAEFLDRDTELIYPSSLNRDRPAVHVLQPMKLP